MIRMQGKLFSCMQMTQLIQFNYRTPKKIGTFKERIHNYNHLLHKYDRQFHMRAPDLSTKNQFIFPIKIPFLVRHRYNPQKAYGQFLDNTQKIHWNRLTPNEMLLGLQNVQYLAFDELIEGLKYLSEVKGQESHDWNAHPWVSKCFQHVNVNFVRIKKKDYLKFYYLFKKLNYKNQVFWKKIYQRIEQMVYDLYPSEFQMFFLKYYKVSDQYFSPQMKQKFITLMQGRLREFSPGSIIQIFQIYFQQNRLDDYWKYNVFIPLFKNTQYNYHPVQLCQIFRFMLLIQHEKDDRLYEALYRRIYKYKFKSRQEVEMMEEVVSQVKELFISHRVEPHLQYLATKKEELKSKSEDKKISIHQLVRQDLIFFMQKRKLKNHELVA